MKLNELRDQIGATHARKRVGRGIGSGTGKTGGRGVKGQTSRSGVALNGFEGGQMPIYRRLPKRGFNNLFSKDYNIVSVGTIQALVDAGKLDVSKPVTVSSLKEIGIFRKEKDGYRLLGDGEITSSVQFELAGASASALEKVEKAGGSVKLLVVSAE